MQKFESFWMSGLNYIYKMKWYCSCRRQNECVTLYGRLDIEGGGIWPLFEY
jgi:hypothetical protein